MKKGYDVKVFLWCFEYADTPEEAQQKVYERMNTDEMWNKARDMVTKQSKDEVMSSIEVQPKEWFVPDENTHRFMRMMCDARLGEYNEKD